MHEPCCVSSSYSMPGKADYYLCLAEEEIGGQGVGVTCTGSQAVAMTSVTPTWKLLRAGMVLMSHLLLQPLARTFPASPVCVNPENCFTRPFLPAPAPNPSPQPVLCLLKRGISSLEPVISVPGEMQILGEGHAPILCSPPPRAGLAWDPRCSLRHLLINPSVASLHSGCLPNLLAETPATLLHLPKARSSPQPYALLMETVPYQSSAPGSK